jgi:hypothetical protein
VTVLGIDVGTGGIRGDRGGGDSIDEVCAVRPFEAMLREWRREFAQHLRAQDLAASPAEHDTAAK